SIMCWSQAGGLTVKASPPGQFPPPPDQVGKGDGEFEISAQGKAGIGAPALPVPPRGSGTSPAPHRPPDAGGLRIAFTPLDLRRLDATRVARPSYSDRDPPRLEYDGAGLASVLAYLALNDPQGFEDLVAVARSLIPRLRRIRFRKAKVYRTESELVR